MIPIKTDYAGRGIKILQKFCMFSRICNNYKSLFIMHDQSSYQITDTCKYKNI